MDLGIVREDVFQADNRLAGKADIVQGGGDVGVIGSVER